MTDSELSKNNSQLDKIKVIAEIGGIISTVIALAALALSLHDLASKAQSEEIRHWQEVVVFSILESAQADGKTFEQINIDYKIAIPETTLPIPRTELTKEALKRILLRLIENKAVVIDYRGNYKVAHEFAMHNPKFAGPIVAAQPLVQSVMQFIRANERTFDATEVARKVSQQQNAKLDDIERIIMEGRSFGMIKMDTNNKLYTDLALMPAPPK